MLIRATREQVKGILAIASVGSVIPYSETSVVTALLVPFEAGWVHVAPTELSSSDLLADSPQQNFLRVSSIE
jgi:hypothetical protein